MAMSDVRRPAHSADIQLNLPKFDSFITHTIGMTLFPLGRTSLIWLPHYICVCTALCPTDKVEP